MFLLDYAGGVGGFGTSRIFSPIWHGFEKLPQAAKWMPLHFSFRMLRGLCDGEILLDSKLRVVGKAECLRTVGCPWLSILCEWPRSYVRSNLRLMSIDVFFPEIAGSQILMNYEALLFTMFAHFIPRLEVNYHALYIEVSLPKCQEIAHDSR